MGPQGRALVERAQKILREGPEGQAALAEARATAEAAVRRREAPARADEEFANTTAQRQAATFEELSKGVSDGRQMLSRLQVLEGVTGDLPSGILGWFSQQGARLGLGPQVPQYEVASALLKQLIPSARQGMPGAVSDRDAANFEASLPRLMATPEGRQMVIDTLKIASEDQIARGRIARQAQTGQITRQQAIAMLDDLPSPFARFSEYQAQAGRDAAGRPLPAQQPGAAPAAPAQGATNRSALEAEARRRGLIQ